LNQSHQSRNNFRLVRFWRKRNYNRIANRVVIHGTIAQLCRAVSSQLRHVSTIRKKLVKHRYLLHMTS